MKESITPLFPSPPQTGNAVKFTHIGSVNVSVSSRNHSTQSYETEETVELHFRVAGDNAYFVPS